MSIGVCIAASIIYVGENFLCVTHQSYILLIQYAHLYSQLSFAA
jgi:hypothetical protein